ncbi:MAG: hypothetical protein AAF967_08565 [Pseudomonadota bacterium]
MHAFAEALADPAVRGAYLALSLTLLILPLVLLWLWYRRRDRAGTIDRPMLMRVGLLTLLWMLANAAALGFLMWADGLRAAAS